MIKRLGSLDQTDTFSRFSVPKKISKPCSDEGLDTKAATTDPEERQKVPKITFHVELIFEVTNVTQDVYLIS